jgi:hypothetical protein
MTLVVALAVVVTIVVLNAEEGEWDGRRRAVGSG